jgi:hypothetical protein
MSEDVDGKASKALPPRMSTAAQADAMSVERIIKLASEGRLRMPSFQRPLRWEAPDRRALLDSIYRGYPVGTLLLWKNPPNGTEGGRPLDANAPAPRQGDHYLVIDGQQRLTTLWDALGRKPRAGESSLVFDMDRGEFRSRALKRAELDATSPILEGAGLPAVPLHLVLDAATLSEWVPQGLSRDVKRRYFELGTRIREYKLGLYVVEDADMDVLRHVFDRVNTTGKQMERDEVFDALIGSRVAVDGMAGLALVNERLTDLRFGKLDPSTILKALEAVRGDKVGRLDPRELGVREAEADLLRTANALQAAISFLRDVAHVPHVEVCPYELPLVVLARFFAYYPHPSERSLILLRRWLWRASLGERLGGASGSTQQHVDDVVTNGEDASVQALLRRTGSPENVRLDWDLAEALSLATARGMMLVCALLDQQPRDLETGERIEVEELFRNGKTGLLRSIVREPAAGPRDGIVNRLLHPPGARKPRQLIVECTDEAALFSHGIDSQARDALREGDMNAFRRRRGEVFHRWIHAFFEGQAELQRDDAPSLATLTRQSA